jgi:ATP-binding cassette, subfamily B, bacterial
MLLGAGRARSPALVRLYLEVSPPLTLALLACVVVAGVSAPAFTLATGALASAVQDGKWTLPPLVAAGALFALQRLLEPWQGVVTGALARRVDAAQTERVLRAIASPPGLAHVEDPAVRDTMARAQGGLTGATPGGAADSLAGVYGQWVQGVLALGLVLAWRWWAALALAVAYVVAFAVSRWHFHHVTLVIYGRTTQLRRAYYLRSLALGGGVAKETRVFGLAPWLVNQYRDGWLAVMREIWSRRREGWLAALGIFALAGLVELGVLATLVGQGAAGRISLAQAVTTVSAVLGAGILTFYGNQHWYLGESLSSLAELEALERAAGGAGGVVGGSASAETLPRRSIRFESVSFTYPGGSEPVLASLDLEIEAGRSLAIVGDNGAGKTTLVKLLARLHDPQAGRIIVDGTDLRTLAPRSWHRRVAAIFQDFVQFELSAHDNVAFGALDRGDDRAAVERAAEQAGARAIVERLPQGWQTPLSRELEGGAQLSGGEWQRLALARALFAVQAGAGVLVLDEPTASLDVRGEAEVYDRFLELTRGVTSVVISHRFSTVRRADRIVVLAHGRVAESGTHDELIRAGGRYAAMYTLQASRFGGAEADPDG